MIDPQADPLCGIKLNLDNYSKRLYYYFQYSVMAIHGHGHQFVFDTNA